MQEFPHGPWVTSALFLGVCELLDYILDYVEFLNSARFRRSEPRSSSARAFFEELILREMAKLIACQRAPGLVHISTYCHRRVNLSYPVARKQGSSYSHPSGHCSFAMDAMYSK